MLQDDDALIEQQLRQDFGFQSAHAQTPIPLETMANAEGGTMEDIATMVNEVAFRGATKSPMEGAGRGKRKRPDEATAEESLPMRGKRGTGNGIQGAATSTGAADAGPAKRGRPKKTQKRPNVVIESPTAQTPVGRKVGGDTGETVTSKSPASAKPAPGKLPRPTRMFRETRRHMIEVQPAVAPKKRVKNVYDDLPDSPETKSAVAKPMLIPKPPSQVGGARRSGRRIKNNPATADSATAMEGYSSAILNGRAEPGGHLGESTQTRSYPESTENVLSSTPAGGDRGGKGKAIQRSNQAKKRAGKGPSRTKKSARDEYADHEQEIALGGEGQDRGPGEGQAQSEGHGSVPEGSSPMHNDGDDDEEVEEDDEDEDPEDSKFLGQKKEWREILDAARSICGKKLLQNKMPTLLTETIEDLLVQIQESRSIYWQLLPYAGIDHDQIDGLREQLQECLTAIEHQINDQDISERSAASKRSEMIQDIYCYAIPALVLLLRDAFAFYAPPPKGRYNYEVLQEIVRLQDMIIFLCEKAGNWKAKPLTDSPIIKPNRRVIFPYVRNMRNNAFKVELAEQRRKWKMQQNAEKTKRREAEELEQSQQQREISLPSTAPAPGRIMEDVQRNRMKWRASRDTVGPPREEENAVVQIPSPPNRIEPPRSSTEWNEEKLCVLFKQLEQGYNRNQDGE